MAKVQYPNPKFFRAKDDIDWKKQGENLKEVMGIFGGMLKTVDWKAFAKKTADDFKADGERAKGEFKDFMALSGAEKWDRVVNGERSLGRLYRKGAMATVRREWRGVKDTAYDFLMTFSKDLIPAMNSALWYRWMISYFCCHGFMDKNILGLRGSNLRMSHELTYQIFRYVAENLVLLSKADRKNGNSTALNKMMITFDEMTMGQIMAGFPDLCGIPHQLLPMFLVSEIDQLVCIPYIDAVESYGLPSDTCPVPSSECGALVINALPDMGSGFISSSMPCDGSTMASSYFSRRFPNIPVFHLCFPVRYMDEETVQMGADGDRPRASEVGDQQVLPPAAHRTELRALPQVELRDGRRHRPACPSLHAEGQPHAHEGLRERRDRLARAQDEVPRPGLVLPGPLLRQLLQLAGQLLGHRRPGRDGVPELHQAPRDRGQGRSAA